MAEEEAVADAADAASLPLAHLARPDHPAMMDRMEDPAVPAILGPMLPQLHPNSNTSRASTALKPRMDLQDPPGLPDQTAIPDNQDLMLMAEVAAHPDHPARPDLEVTPEDPVSPVDPASLAQSPKFPAAKDLPAHPDHLVAMDSQEAPANQEDQVSPDSLARPATTEAREALATPEEMANPDKPENKEEKEHATTAHHPVPLPVIKHTTKACLATQHDNHLLLLLQTFSQQIHNLFLIVFLIMMIVKCETSLCHFQFSISNIFP